jgi:hypothetical protein
VLAADTNVWARAYLNDDAAQAGKARTALAEARSSGGLSSLSSFLQNSPGYFAADGIEQEFLTQSKAFSRRGA